MRSCPVCHAADAVHYCNHAGVEFLRCRRCDCLYQAQPPDWQRLELIYQEEYHTKRGHSGDPALEAVKHATTRSYLRLIEKLQPPGRRLLEVGCSAGVSLEAAAAIGWNVEGIELSVDSAETARKRPGVRTIHTGTLVSAPILPDSFDVIALFDVIEHIDPPQETLAAIYRALRPGGLVLMVTPDAGSISARWMNSKWPHLFLEHVIVYSRGALRDSLSRAGLTVEKIGFAWKRVNLNMLVRHATIHSHIAFGSVLRLLGKVVPTPLQHVMVPFNIGEFYIVARKPAK